MYPVALNYTKNTQKHIKSLLKASPHTKNSFKTSDYATSRFQTIKKQNVVLPPGSKSFTNKLKRNLCIANCKHRARWTSRHGISSKTLGTAARHDNGHVASLASSLALTLRSDRSTLAVAGVSIFHLPGLVGSHYPSQNRSCAQREPCGSSHHETDHCL